MDPQQPPDNVVPFAAGAPRMPGGPAAAEPPAGPPPVADLFTSEVLPLPTEGRGSMSWWRKELEGSVSRIDAVRQDWENNLRSYRAKSLRSAPTTDTVTVPRDFTYVEQKKSTLFFQLPDVHLTPGQDTPAVKNAVPLFQAVLNHYLGEEEIDALATVNEVMFDVLCPSGIMVSVLGYENFAQGTVPMKVGEEPDPDQAVTGPSLGQPNPTGLPGAVLNIGTPAPKPPMRPVMEDVPDFVAENFFWTRISPACARLPRKWSGSKYDRAPWLGYDASEDWDIIKRRFGLPADMKKPGAGKGDPDKLRLPGEPSSDATKGSDDEALYTVIWYHTAYLDPKEVHPEKFRQLVIVAGSDTPLVHRDSPFQWMNNDGELMGMRGNPIHIGALRYVSDTALPPSEASIGRAIGDELNKGRTQMLVSRDRSRPMRFADLSRIGGTTGLAKLQKNIDQAVIPLATAHKADPPVFATELAHLPVEDWKFNEIVSQDYDGVWGLGPASRNEVMPNGASATEIKDSRMWSDNRIDGERRAMLRYYLGAVRKIGALIQMFADTEQYVEVLGPDKEPMLQTWDKTKIAGRFAYHVKPNSALRVDQAQAQTQSLKRYELLRKDPNVNGIELLDNIAEESDLDRHKLIIPQTPAKPPDQPNISFRFNAADLDVRNPNFPIYAAILKRAGYDFDAPVMGANGQPEPPPVDQALHVAKLQAQANVSAHTGTGVDPLPAMEVPPPAAVIAGHSLEPAEHPGTAPHADRISKHRADETGQPAGRPPIVNEPHKP